MKEKDGEEGVSSMQKGQNKHKASLDDFPLWLASIRLRVVPPLPALCLFTMECDLCS